MATSGVRLVLKFNLDAGFKITGWSESFDLIYADIPSAVAAIDAINTFVQKRLFCLGAGVTLESSTLIAYPAGVIVPPTPRRNTYPLPVPPLKKGASLYNTKLSVGEDQANSDYAQTVLYFSVATSPAIAPQYRRNVWIAGFPDAASDTQQPQPTVGPWNTPFNAFRLAMSTDDTVQPAVPSIMAIRSVDRTAGNAIKPVTAYDAATNVYTVPAHGFVAGQLVIAEGFRAKAGETIPKGQYRVDFKTNDTFKLVGAAVVTARMPQGGFRAVIYVWNAAVQATQIGFSKRNKGRPFGQSVGRRSKPRTNRS